VIRAIVYELAGHLRAAGVDHQVIDVDWPAWVSEIAPARLIEAAEGVR